MFKTTMPPSYLGPLMSVEHHDNDMTYSEEQSCKQTMATLVRCQGMADRDDVPWKKSRNSLNLCICSDKKKIYGGKMGIIDKTLARDKELG